MMKRTAARFRQGEYPPPHPGRSLRRFWRRILRSQPLTEFVLDVSSTSESMASLLGAGVSRDSVRLSATYDDADELPVRHRKGV
jgi:hypothetical protein